MFLQKISSPADLKKLSLGELKILCQEIRDFLILDASKHGGHFGSSLGVVELTVALHYVFDLPKDMIVWDVGHQAYVHKLLTGRQEKFSTKRKKGGLAPFPHPAESEYDSSISGHASVSISTALGLDIADKIQNPTGARKNIIAVIGDGALTGGQSFEALNNTGDSDTDILVILNDNQMSIDPNIGGLQKSLVKLSKSKTINHLKGNVKNTLKNFLGHIGEVFEHKISSLKQALKNLIYTDHNFFESLHLQYYGPHNGHDLENLIEKLEILKDTKGAKVLHLLTTKGKGFHKAEQEQTKWHATSGFSLNPNSPPVKGDLGGSKKFQEVFGETLLELMKQNKKIVGVTPAMPTGCSMTIAQKIFPEKIFDVGIAEPHAVTFSAGLAKGGLTPFCNIYSTFTQRAVDQIIHDCCIEKINVIFCLDRAGFVGEDGETHQGAFDISLLSHIPNLTILAPRNGQEIHNMMVWASEQNIGPIVIRYPKGNIPDQNFSLPDAQKNYNPLQIEKIFSSESKKSTALLTLGTLSDTAQKALQKISIPNQKIFSLFDIKCISPLNEKSLHKIFSSHHKIFIFEEGSISGGIGEKIIAWKEKNGYNHILVSTYGIPKKFIAHTTREEQLDECGLSEEKIFEVLITQAPLMR